MQLQGAFGARLAGPRLAELRIIIDGQLHGWDLASLRAFAPVLRGCGFQLIPGQRRLRGAREAQSATDGFVPVRRANSFLDALAVDHDLRDPDALTLYGSTEPERQTAPTAANADPIRVLSGLKPKPLRRGVYLARCLHRCPTVLSHTEGHDAGDACKLKALFYGTL